MSENYIERLNRMSPAELEAERARANAHAKQVREAAYGRVVDVVVDGVKTQQRVYDVPMPGSRADEARQPMRAVTHKDDVGRVITEYVGGSMNDWMGQFKNPVYRQQFIRHNSQDFTLDNIMAKLAVREKKQ